MFRHTLLAAAAAALFASSAMAQTATPAPAAPKAPVKAHVHKVAHKTHAPAAKKPAVTKTPA